MIDRDNIGNRLIIIFIFISLFYSQVVDSQICGSPVTWTTGPAANNHSYCYVALNGIPSWAEILNGIAATSKYQGKSPYLGTITSEEEYTFVAANVPTGSLYQSIDREVYNSIRYSSGPERGDVQYDIPNQVGTLYNKYQAGYPTGDPSLKYGYMTTGSGGSYLLAVTPPTTSALYVIEFSDMTDPYVPPISTQGGQVMMKYLDRFVVQDVSIIVTPFDGVPVSCDILLRDSQYKTVVFNMPASTGNGINYILISDSSTTFNITYWKYKAPAVYSLYPTRTGNGAVITLVGDNFGTDKSIVKINTGYLGHPCLYVDIIDPHTTVTCAVDHPITLTTNLYPISVKVGSSSTITSNRIAFYDDKSVRMIRLNQYISANSFAINSIIGQREVYLEGHMPYLGLVETDTQSDIIKRTWAWQNFPSNQFFLTSIMGNGSNIAVISNNGGPRDGEAIYRNNVCQNIYCGDNYAFSTVAGVSTLIDRNGYRANAFSGEFVMYGSTPYIAPQDLSIDAAGGMIIVPLTSGTVGFKYTKRSYAINNVTLPYPITVINNKTLGLTIPPGVSLNFNLSITIEGTTFGGLRVNYTTPSVLSIPPVSTMGGVVTIYGYAFGNDASVVTISIDGVPCPNIVLLSNQTILSCVAPPGVGGKKTMLISVNGTQQSVFFSYIAPTPTIVVQVGTSLTIYGTNFGNADYTPTVYVPYPVNVTLVYDSAVQVLTATVPVYAQNGKIFVSAGNQMGSVSYVYRPLIHDITAITSTEGNVITITGNFLTQYRTDGSQTNFRAVVGGRTCSQPEFSYNTNGTYVFCTAPAGSGAPIDAYVTVDGISSNIISMSYPKPSVSSFIQTGTSMTIFGDNFGPDLDRIKFNLNGSPLSCQSVLSKPSRLFCSIPGTTKNGNFSITVQGQTSNVVPLTLIPTISTVTVQDIYGGNILIYGTFFNILDWQGNVTNFDITLGQDIPCSNPRVYYTNTQVICTLGAGTGTKTLNFTLGPNTVLYTWSYIAPSVQYQNYLNDQLILNGTGIGTDMSKISLNVYSQTPLNIATLVPFNTTGSRSRQNVIFDLPLDTLNGNSRIYVDGLASNQFYIRTKPIVYSASGDFPSPGGGSITLYGERFNRLEGSGRVVGATIYIDVYVCRNVVIYNSSCLIATTGYGTGLNKKGFLYLDNVESSPFWVNFTAPNVTKITQTGTMLEVAGTNFGTIPRVIVFTFGPLVNATSYYATQVLTRANVSPFSQNGNFSLVVDGQASDPFPFKFTPVVTFVSSVDYAGGNITIQGNFFNSTTIDGQPTNPKVYVGTKGMCTNITYLSNDVANGVARIVCNAPPGTTTDIDIPLNVEIDGINGTIKFTYGAPQLNSYTITTANFITLKGYQFGTDITKVQVYFATTLMTVTSITDTEISFQAPVAMYNENVYVRSITNAKSTGTLFVKLYPLIKTTTPATTDGGRSTITGNWLNRQTGSVNAAVRVMIGDRLGSVNSLVQTNNQQMIINSPPGTGVNNNLTIVIDGLATSIYTFSYAPPTIFNVLQSGTTLVFNGTNYGTNVSNVYTTPFTAVTSISDYLLTATVSRDTKNGPYNIQVDGQTSANYNLYLTPIITSVVPAPTNGTNDITIKGTFINQNRVDGSLTNSSVFVNNITCPITSFTSNTQLTCTIPNGIFRNANLTLAIDGKTTRVSYNSLGPEIYSVSNPPLYLQAQVITINGKNFYDPAVVYIGGHECTNAHTIDVNTLYCSFDSTIQPALPAASVTVVSTGLTGTAIVFKYADLTCQNNCSNHGTCYNGICSCAVGFGGALCHAAINLTIPIPTASVYNGTVTADQTVYNVGLQFIREIDQFGVTIRVHESSKLQWSLSATNDYGIYISNTYTAPLLTSSTSATVSVQTYEFSNGALMQFGGEILSEGSHSFKHQVSIDNYNFSGPSNTLQVIYSTSTPQTFVDGCKTNQTAYNLFYAQNSTSLLAFDFETKYSIFTARFSSRIMTDNMISAMNIQSLSQSDPLWSSQDGVLQSMVVINVPHHNFNAQFDPNFIATVKGLNGECNPNTTTAGATTSVTAGATTTAPSTTDSQTTDGATTTSPTAGQTTTTTGQTTATTTTDPTTTTTTVDPTTTTTTTTASQSTTTTASQTTTTTSATTTSQTSVVLTATTQTITNPTSTGPVVTCPGTPVCSGHGTCVGQLGVYKCVCQGNWLGSDCSSETSKIPPPTDPSTDHPGTNQTDQETGVNLGINVISLREITFIDELVEEYQFKNWTFSKIASNESLIYLYQTDVIRDGKATTQVNVTVQYFYYDTSVTFAGVTTVMQPGSLKYSVSMNAFQFATATNQLQILFSAYASTQNDGSCSLKEYEVGDNSKDLVSISLQINGRTLYGQFSKWAVVDGRISHSTNEIVSKDQPSDTNSMTRAVVAVGVSSYQNNVIIDPNFSLLISADADSKQGSVCGSTSTKLANGALAGIVVGSVVGASVIIAGGISVKKYRVQKKANEKQASRLKSLNGY